MKYISAFFLMFFMYLFPLQAQADDSHHDSYNSGHYGVTLPKNCAALAGDARPAIHYLSRSYARCMEISKKMLHEAAENRNSYIKEAPNEENGLFQEDKRQKPEKKYYRVTPVTEKKE